MKIRFISEDLRKLADRMDNAEKYGSMCGIAYLTINEHPNGKSMQSLNSLVDMQIVIATITDLMKSKL